jgi:threonine synthase
MAVRLERALDLIPVSEESASASEDAEPPSTSAAEPEDPDLQGDAGQRSASNGIFSSQFTTIDFSALEPGVFRLFGTELARTREERVASQLRTTSIYAPNSLLKNTHPSLQLAESPSLGSSGVGTGQLPEIQSPPTISEPDFGSTFFQRARNLERYVGLKRLFLKFEGSNPTGTQKDRIADAQVRAAVEQGYRGVTVASCGNHGTALAFAARRAGLRCVVFIPEAYHTPRVQEMVELGAAVVRVPVDYENAVALSQERAEAERFYDANPGGQSVQEQLRAYHSIAFEIVEDLGAVPDVVAVPVSNGTTLAGIYQGFERLKAMGSISRLPRMVAGSSRGKNPIITSFQNQEARCVDLPPERIRESAINEPLVNWHSFDGDLALSAVRSSGGWAAGVSDNELRDLSLVVRRAEGIDVLPASLAGALALLSHARDRGLSLAAGSPRGLTEGSYVIVLTGRRGA